MNLKNRWKIQIRKHEYKKGFFSDHIRIETEVHLTSVSVISYVWIKARVDGFCFWIVVSVTTLNLHSHHLPKQKFIFFRCPHETGERKDRTLKQWESKIAATHLKGKGFMVQIVEWFHIWCYLWKSAAPGSKMHLFWSHFVTFPSISNVYPFP